MITPAAYIFDAYGTLFDVHSAAARHRDEIGPDWERFSALWRTKHLEYTWITALAGRHDTFWKLAGESLDFAAASIGGIAPDIRAKLLAAYRTLSAYPDVPAVLDGLRAKSAKLAILTNGDPDMIADAVRSAGLDGKLDAVITVHEAGIFKPSPLVYALVEKHFGCAPADVSFQSSNRWDIAGAAAFGFRTVWINRSGAPDEYPGMPANRTVRDLSALLH